MPVHTRKTIDTANHIDLDEVHAIMGMRLHNPPDMVKAQRDAWARGIGARAANPRAWLVSRCR